MQLPDHRATSRLWRKLAGSCVILLAALFLTSPLASAASTNSRQGGVTAPKNKGLYITPIRQFVSMDAGKTRNSTITIGNFTDYSYGIQFGDAPVNRIHFPTEQYELKSNESKTIPYEIFLPANTPPGGQYYTLFATGSGSNGKAKQQVQTTSLLYLTVNGKLSHGSRLERSSISHFSFRSNIPYRLDIANTGNIHYFVYLNAKLHGWLSSSDTSSETHLLLPHTSRHFESSIKSPVLPGVYRATYGYTTEFEKPVTSSSWVIYLPPWSLVLVVLVLWGGWLAIRHHRRGKHSPD
jgi:hypothetical protein